MSGTGYKSKPVDNSEENIEFFKKRLEDCKKYVHEMLMGKAYGEPEIVPGLDKLRQEVAEHVFALLKEKGKVFRNDLNYNDINRLREIQKKRGGTFEDAMNTLVKNSVYQSIERQFAENFVLVIRDVEKVMQQYGDRLKVFPMNALSDASLAKLNSNKVGISNATKLKMILDTYVPGFMNLDVVDIDYSVVAKKSYALSEVELNVLANEIKKNFGDQEGSIDKIFARENSKGLSKLLGTLARNNLTFEQFADRFGLKYTRCYIIPASIAGKHMVSEYYKKFGTYRFIKENDLYLHTKLRSIRLQEGRPTNIDLFKSWGFDTSEMVEPNNAITVEGIKRLQKTLIDELNELYPSKVVEENFTRKFRNVYNLANNLSKKLGFEDLSSYLASLGFKWEKEEYRSTFRNQLCLSERDLMYYNFFGDAKDPEKIEEIMKNMEIKLASVEDYAGFYTKLAYEKCDVYYHVNAKPKQKNDED